MSASPSGWTDVDTSDSESNHSVRAPSPLTFQGPPAASTRSKKRTMAQSTANPVPAILPPQPSAASTRAKKLSTKSTTSTKSNTPTMSNTLTMTNTPTKTSTSTQPWMVQSTKSRIRPDANDISPVASSVQTATSTTLSSDVEEVKIIAESSQPPKPAGVSQVKSSDSPPAPEPARLISSETFREATNHAWNCRELLFARYKDFLRELDPKASHYKHLKEPPTLETSLPQLLHAVTHQHSGRFLQMSELRSFWETVKDLHKTEGLVLKTLRAAGDFLAKADLNKSEADGILGHLTSVNTSIDAFCTRMSTRLSLTAEQSTIFGEGDLTHLQLLYFRLAGTDNLPSVEERFRLLWDVYPIHGMRRRFHAWNQALLGNNAGLKAMLDTLSDTIAAHGTEEKVQIEARGVKRKAEDEIEDEDEQ